MCKICGTNNCNCPKPNIIPLCGDGCSTCSTPCGGGKVVSSRYGSCGDCKDNCNNVANIIAGKHIKIKAFDNNCGKDVEVEAERPKVASDGTMSVQLGTMNGTAFTPNPEGDTWYLRVTCCTDKLVGVSPTDTPGYLQNKIRLCTSLTSAGWSLLPQEVTPGNYVMELCAPITNTDEKVAAAAGCPPKYLADILNTNYGDYFSFQQIGCNVRLSIQPRCLLHEDIALNTLYTTQVLDDDKVGMLTIPSTLYSRSVFATPISICPASTKVITAADLQSHGYVGTTSNGGNNADPGVFNYFTDTLGIEIKEDGRYTVSSSDVIMTGKGIATIRSFAVAKFPSSPNAQYISEAVLEGPRFEDKDNDNEINSAADLINYEDGFPPSVASLEMQGSMTRSTSRREYNTTRTVRLPAGTLIYKIIKYSTNTAEIASRDDRRIEFKYAGAAGTTAADGGGGTYLSVVQHPYKRISE